MAFKLANRAFVLTATTGTGSISLGSVVAGYQSFSAAGITDGDTVRYTIEDGTNWEIGTGTLSNSVGTMARNVIDSSGGGSALTLSGNAKVFLTAAADDILVEVVEDTSPQLGGNLDVQAREITTSTSNGNIKITPNGSGVVEVKGANGNDGTIQLNCSANSHGVKIKSPPHSAGATYTLTLPNDDGSSGQSLISDGSGNLSFTTITSNATHTGEVTGSGALTIADNIVDEANLKVSNSPINGYFLSAQSGNTGGLTWAAAGAELYVANPQGSITAPTANGDNAVAIGNLSAADGNKSFAAINGRAAGTESTAIGWSRASGTGALALNVHETPYNDTYGASGDYSVSIGKSTKSSGDQSIALGYAANATAQDAMALGRDVIASATYSTAVGYDSEATASTSTSLGFNSKATNSGALALGNRSLASGVSSTAISITSTSTSYGANSDYGIAIGYLAKAGGGRSIVIGYQATANNFANATAIGYEAKVSALGNRGLSLGFRADVQNYGAVAISASKQGYGPIAAGEGSVAIGELVKSQQSGKYAFGVGTFSNAGEAQGGMFILRSDTTDATAEAMTTTNSTADATNQIVAATDTCITFHGTVVAMQNGAQAHAGWEIKGMLVNDGGTTTLALGNVSDMAATNASSWAVALSADNTNNALKVQVTGEAAHNIRWVANIQTSEVTYA